MKSTVATPGVPRQARRTSLARAMRSWQLYAFLLPTLLYFAIFHYGPLYGAQIAFRDYLGALGIWGSPWVGLQNFQRFFKVYQTAWNWKSRLASLSQPRMSENFAN